MSAARARALRAVLSALAGGGLTAASLGAAPAELAYAAGAVQPATEGTSTTATTTESEPPPTATTPTTTSTTPTATTPTTTGTPPAATPPAATTQATTTPAPTTTSPAAPTVAPSIVLRRHQRLSSSAPPATKTETKTGQGTAQNKNKNQGANNVALSPQLIAAQANALASSAASVQALGFYRIPLFLLPIYKAAATQYGVPWQILAAVNEIETDYGTDLSVSSAGAVGWMQFMPATWLQYGVDALDAGYADPYNPVDAIFAAARYLRAAGASNNLEAAILAYNHSQEYVDSVLLRAKLISTYPRSVIATLTGLVDGRLPVTGHHVAWIPLPVPATPAAAAHSATAGATPTAGTAATAAQAAPGSSAAPAPALAAAAKAPAAPTRFDELTTAPKASVVAVQSGRVTSIGASHKLGRYLVLRDVYGDVFTYAGLGSIAPTYTLPKGHARRLAPLVEVAAKHDPAPSSAASAGAQAPVTLQVRKPTKHAHAAGRGSASVETTEGAVAGKVRLFAHPGNPDAVAAAKLEQATRARLAKATHRQALKRGSVVSVGTVLGTVTTDASHRAGHMRFAVRPAGDPATIDPGTVLSNWAQLQSALRPQGARAEDALLGARASDVFLLSKSELQRTVLSDPGITVYACGRHDIASGAVNRRVLAVLAFLSRTGLRPTVTALHCGQSPVTSTGAVSAAFRGNAVEISAINGTPVAGHQGTGSVADLAIRTLLTLPAEFQPESISSLMRYPGAASTHSSRRYWNRIRLEFSPAPKPAVAVSPSAAGSAAHSAKTGKVAAAPTVSVPSLSATQWEQLIQRVAALPAPKVAYKPSSAALPDPKPKTH